MIHNHKGKRFVRVNKPHIYREGGAWHVSGVGFISRGAPVYTKRVYAAKELVAQWNEAHYYSPR